MVSGSAVVLPGMRVWVQLLLCMLPATAAWRAECKLHNLAAYEEKIYSQNGEDGVLLRILEVIGVRNRDYVEFGVQDGVECNSRVLREHLNFTGLMMDGGNENANINLKREFVTVDNVLELFQSYSVPTSFDVLSVDTDLFDWWLLLRILRDGNYRPRVIVVETNPSLGVGISDFRGQFSEANALPLTVVHPHLTDLKTWDLSRYHGANPAAFQKLGKIFGYEMVYCELCGVNCILVRGEDIDSSCDPQSFSLPTVHYPCFGTARTGGAYPGHEVDLLKRRPVHLSDSLMGLLIKRVYALSDVAASLVSLHDEYPLWGSDWCSTLVAAPAMQISGDTAIVATLWSKISEGTHLFEDGQFRDARSHFEEALSAARHMEVICVTKHSSSDHCRLISAIKYNIGLSLLNEATDDEAMFSTARNSINEAESAVSLGNRNQRMKAVASFLSSFSPERISKPTTTWFSFVGDQPNSVFRRRIGMNVCSDPVVVANEYCRSNNIMEEPCAIITLHLKQSHDNGYVKFPRAYYNSDHGKNLHDERLLPAVREVNSFNKDGCMHSHVQKYLSSVKSYCSDVQQNRPLVLVSGLASDTLITASTIIIRALIGNKDIQQGDVSSLLSASPIDRIRAQYSFVGNATIGLLDAFGCDPGSSMHPASFDNDCLMRIVKGEVASEEQTVKVSKVVEDMYAAMYQYSSLSDNIVIGSPFLIFSHNFWRDVHMEQHSANDVHHVFIAPPIEMAVNDMSIALDVSLSIALEKFIALTNNAIEAFSNDYYSSRLLVLTLSESDSSTSAKLIDRVVLSNEEKVMNNSTKYLELVDLLQNTIPSSVPKRSVQIPYWFYKCYESIRKHKLFPESACAS